MRLKDGLVSVRKLSLEKNIKTETVKGLRMSTKIIRPVKSSNNRRPLRLEKFDDKELYRDLIKLSENIT